MAVASLCILCEPGGCRQDLAPVPCHVRGPHAAGTPAPPSHTAAQTAEDCLMLWKLTRVGEVGMDMARATRARMECLSCHRCHRFRTAERTWGCEMGYSVTTWSFRGTSHPHPLFSNPKCYKNARLQAELVFARKEGCRPTPPNPWCSPRCSESSRRLRRRNPGRRQAVESPWSYRWPQAREIWSSPGVWGGLFFGGRRVRHQPQDGLHIPQWEDWDRS